MDNKRTENLRTILEHNLSAEAAENLRTIKNEDEFRKVLADNGIQAEKLQRKLPDDLTYYRRSLRLLAKCKGGDEFGLKIC